jgi:hypothetical protein
MYYWNNPGFAISYQTLDTCPLGKINFLFNYFFNYMTTKIKTSKIKHHPNF